MTGSPARAFAAVDIRGILPAGGTLAPALTAPAAGILVWWAAAEGGYPPTTWYPGALLVLAPAAVAVAAAVAASGPGRGRPARPALWALGCLAAFTAWSFLSMTWAQAPGDAWDGANRTLLYLTVLALFALAPWRAAAAAAALGALAVAIAVLGVVALARAGAGAPSVALDEGRMSAPTGYANASAALFFVAFWLALLLACARGVHGGARAVLLAAAGVLLHLVVLGQSRGSAAAGAAGLVGAVVLSPERRRLLAGGLAVAATTLLSLPVLLAVYGAGDPAAAVRAELVALVVTAAALAIAAARAGPRLDRAPLGAARHARHGRRATVALAALAVAGVAVLSAGGSRFSEGASSGRFDLWRVAARQLAERPVGGAGADNFAHDHARLGRSREEPLYPHGVAFRALGQTGIVGGLLFAGFLGAGLAAAAAGAARAGAGPRARPSPLGPAAAVPCLRPAVAAAGGAAFACWLGHAAVDWLWELPAVTGLAMACLGIATAMAARPPSDAPRRRPAPAAAAAAVLGAAALAAAVSYALPALAAQRIGSAVAVAARDPAAAAARLDQARRLNPLGARADLIAGVIAERTGDPRAARAAFARAAARDGGDWYPHLRLGLLDARGGRRAPALAALRRARALAPREPAVAAALDHVAAGAPVPAWVAERIDGEAVPGPLGRHSIDCRPVLGIAAACRGEGR